MAGSDYSAKLNRAGYIRVFNLAVNMIDFIKARNVQTVMVDRGTRDIEAINRKRARDGKKPIPHLKPYYWIDIRPSTVYQNQGALCEGGQSMEYQEMVMGHTQRYHITDGSTLTHWISPYRRGPVDAPFKNNRHRLLWDMLQQGPKYSAPSKH